MIDKEILLQFYCTGIDGLPRDASFRLESLMADEVRATILTAAMMLTFDAAEDSPVRAELSGIVAKIEAAGDQVKKSWLDRGSMLRERLATAEAWRDASCSVVLTPADRPKTVVWTGNLGAMAATALPLLSAVSLRPSSEAAKWISGWPVPMPTPTAPADLEKVSKQSETPTATKAPEAAVEAAPTPDSDGELELTPADLNASIAAAKAKAEAAAKTKEAAPAPAPADDPVQTAAKKAGLITLVGGNPTENLKALTQEAKIQALMKGGLSMAEARKAVRAGKI